ncbi:MAG TPA: hypothetical protein EYP33_07205, partial [Pyrodictium sp.]|nr:hypothetical protein [Pyrodictium sp.]
MIELRKVLIEYEVYPTQPLYQYIKNASTQTTRRHKKPQLQLTKHEKPHLAPAIGATRSVRSIFSSICKSFAQLSASIISNFASLATSIRDHIHDIVFLAIVVIPITCLFVHNYLAPGYPATRGGDTYGHLFKVWKLCTSGYHGWIHEWHAGYPFLRFYPPLSYFLACWFAKLPGLDYIAGFKLVMVSSLIIAAMAMRLALGLLSVTPLVAWLAGLMYSFTVWHLRNIAPEGNMPMAFGYALAPLAVYALAACHQQRPRLSRLLFAGLGIGLLILTHHTSAVFTILSLIPVALVLILTDTLASKNKLRTLARIVLAYVIVALIGLAVAAPWLVPFLE